MYISEFRQELISDKKLKPEIYKNTVNNNRDNLKFLRIISKYLRKKQLKLSVALVSNRKDKKYSKDLRNTELKFFKLIDENVEFPKVNSYELAEKSKIIFSNISNLGLELQSLKHKVLFYQIGRKKINDKNIEKLIQNSSKTNLKKKHMIKYDMNNSLLKDIVNRNIKV